MTRALRIGDTVIDDNSPAYCIAEVGSNAQADTGLTKRFIKAAADAGASAVKLQKRSIAQLYTRAALAAPYVHDNSFGPTYGEHRLALEYSIEQMTELLKYSHAKGLSFGVTPFDIPSASLLACIGVDFLKIASACITDTVLLDHCAQLGIPMVVSTGTGTQHDVDLAVETITRHGCPLAVLQCSAIYPLEDPSLLNLRVIQTYRARYPDLVTGLSSHLPQWTDAAVAVMLGGRIIEKHFTLDRQMKGADHSFSLEPKAFLDMTWYFRELLPQMLGSAAKMRLPEEDAAIRKMGKTLRAARDLPAGHVLDRDSISIKSPGGDGPEPSRLAEFIGRALPVALAEDQPLPDLRWYE